MTPVLTTILNDNSKYISSDGRDVSVNVGSILYRRQTISVGSLSPYEALTFRGVLMDTFSFYNGNEPNASYFITWVVEVEGAKVHLTDEPPAEALALFCVTLVHDGVSSTIYLFLCRFVFSLVANVLREVTGRHGKGCEKYRTLFTAGL